MLTLAKAGITPQFGGRYAREAKEKLKEFGFINLLDFPENQQMHDPLTAPIGAIIVYWDGVSNNPGHVELKANDDEWISDFTSHKAFSEYNPRGIVTGVMILPDL